MKNMLSTFINNNAYISSNLEIERVLGIESTRLLGELGYWNSVFESSENITEDGFFYLLGDKIEYRTNISKYKQQKCFEFLEFIRFINTDLRGTPAKKYFRLNFDVIQNTLNIWIENKVCLIKWYKTKVEECKKAEKEFLEQHNGDVNIVALIRKFRKQVSKNLETSFLNLGNKYNIYYKDNNLENNIPYTLSKDSVKGIAHPEGGDATHTPQTQSKNNQICYPSGGTKKESNCGCFRGKKSLISNPPTPLSEEDLVCKVTNTKTRTQQTEEESKPKNTQFKRPRYLGSVRNIVSMELNLQDQDKLQEIVDWFDSIYDKGVTTTKGVRFRKCMLQLIDFYKKYSWSELQGVLDTCTQNAYCKLDYGLNKSSRNTIQKSAKYFDMKEGETVEEWNKRYFSERRRVKDAVKTDIRSIYNTEDIK